MKTYVITAGHSNVDPGAVANGQREAVLAVELRDIIAAKLREKGYTVLTDGQRGDNKPLSSAIKLIKQGDVAVEIHFNAAANPAAAGVETIALPKHKALAQRLSQAIAGVAGSKLRGDAGYIDQSKSARGRLGYVSAGGLIVEVAFISNRAEMAAYQAKKWLVASAIVEALLK